MDLTDKLRQNPETPTRDIDGFVHVIDPAKGMLHSFNEVGSRIWALLADPVTVSSIVKTLAEEYDVEAAQLEADVIQFLEALRSQELIVDAS